MEKIELNAYFNPRNGQYFGFSTHSLQPMMDYESVKLIATRAHYNQDGTQIILDNGTTLSAEEAEWMNAPLGPYSGPPGVIEQMDKDFLAGADAELVAWLTGPPRCPKCSNEAAEPHPCPYDQDVNNNPGSICTCCDACTHECLMAI